MLHEPLCAKDLGLQPDDLHVFVLSDAGKPIYSRYGDETKLAHLMGVMQALVSVASQDGDELRTIITEERKIVFRTCGHLILVAVGPQIAPTGHLTTVLKYVYNQVPRLTAVPLILLLSIYKNVMLHITPGARHWGSVGADDGGKLVSPKRQAEARHWGSVGADDGGELIVSALTVQRIEKWFTQKHNLDLRNLLIGDSRILSGAIEQVETQLGPTLNAVLCIPLSVSVRDTVVQAITQPIKSQDLVFAILLTNYRVVCIVSMKKHFLHPTDIHLVTNLVRCSQSFKAAPTNWLPICLPKFNPNGYLYANLSYLDEHSCLVLLTVDSNQFYALQTSKDQILSRLLSALNGECLSILASSACPDVTELSIPGLRHFVCKLTSAAQYTTCRWAVPYALPHNSSKSDIETDPQAARGLAATMARRRNVLNVYRNIHSKLHCSLHPLNSLFIASDTEVFLGSRTNEYDVYITMEPFVEKLEAFETVKKVIKWINSRKQRLFLLYSPTF
ncbi:unnamed protein product [Schistocephalus solidus]|uniref:Vacuolar fusion protein MON1 homolog n=1 Tax=Schistocephalus solidus TaxID=70667 RepID=A0A183SKA6_SCHSO|nr:unnamed protein product [Schistocephalus solidus]